MSFFKLISNIFIKFETPNVQLLIRVNSTLIDEVMRIRVKMNRLLHILTRWVHCKYFQIDIVNKSSLFL